CDADYYDTDGDTGGRSCSGVGTGYYSTGFSNTRTACSTGPTNSYYSSSGGGLDNCGFLCNSSLTVASRCTQTGTNSNITYHGINTYYANLTIGSGSKFYINNSNITIGKLNISTTGDSIFISNGSRLIINGSL
ncbi:MAG: hypothetical protein HYT73_01915, partial [Candidatus Aenigmarchaeota archaeon]|nr:hypothetical protein [Candidatus Aenigmarchaeota archaeon]